MLLPIDMKPENYIYYYGVIILEELYKVNKINIIDLYNLLKKRIKISLISYSLTLDWLYMIESVYIDEKGGVNLCISKD